MRRIFITTCVAGALLLIAAGCGGAEDDDAELDGRVDHGRRRKRALADPAADAARAPEEAGRADRPRRDGRDRGPDRARRQRAVLRPRDRRRTALCDLQRRGRRARGGLVRARLLRAARARDRLRRGRARRRHRDHEALGRQPALAVARQLAAGEAGVRLGGDGRLALDAAPCRRAASSTVYAPQSGPCEAARAPAASTRHGASPAPTIVCFAPAGQCTKSHCRRGRSSPSITRSASPASTRKSSWSASQWYIAIGSPGASRVRLMPSSWKSVAPSKPAPSNSQRTPRPSRRHHWASRALSTNQPSPLGTRPCSRVTSCASGTIGKPSGPVRQP